ncbi:protein CHROMOSOME TRANSMISSION FIDELITY 7 isoform X2 [Dendrobium catenatum]|uniref:protein CHROMOSOME TRANSMISSION FIDELITY 7 isoform X2 n=1 Tax=Dendrobium catenatum TaxID=906689 RepID=UPI0010A08744|nr:protein CHROMOSOME TRANSMISSION FIDELITY 7 isoform X2 [Dendrobium catenatum]
MPQPKISSFFQPSFPETQHALQVPNKMEAWHLLSGVMNADSRSVLAFKDSNLDPKSDCDEFPPSERSCEYKKSGSSLNPCRNLSKKRRYEQYHLDFGQSDFILYSCSVCGLMYSRGVEEDERVHRKFHQDYDRGIQFKGWHNERVVSDPWTKGDRILLILDSDSSTQKRLVYLFISAHRIVGWLVAEPIQTAHRVIPNSSSGNSFDSGIAESPTKEQMGIADSKKSKETTLQFGDFKFRRELVKKDCPATSTKLNKWDCGAIICEEKAVPAKCGIMAIWVVPSSRRKKVATQLMDAARKSFCTDQILDISKCAFSPPTSAGLAFASSYTNSRSFLVYRADDV